MGGSTQCGTHADFLLLTLDDFLVQHFWERREELLKTLMHLLFLFSSFPRVFKIEFNYS